MNNYEAGCMATTCLPAGRLNLVLSNLSVEDSRSYTATIGLAILHAKTEGNKQKTQYILRLNDSLCLCGESLFFFKRQPQRAQNLSPPCPP